MCMSACACVGGGLCDKKGEGTYMCDGGGYGACV